MTFPLTMPSADFVIVTALEEERDAVLGKLPNPQKLGPFGDDIRVYFSSNLPVTFPDGSAGTYHVIALLLLGMGRVEAATATIDAIRRWNPRHILLIGIAGGIAEEGIRLGDILVSTQVVDYELQKLTPEEPEIRWEVHQADPRLVGAARNFSDSDWLNMITVERPARGRPMRHMGPVASGDKVIAAAEILAKYRDKWPKLIGVEMEAAGVATAAFQAAQQPGFFMVRGVSDLADANKNSARVKKWRLYACDIAASYAIALLKNGPVTLSPFYNHLSDNTQRSNSLREEHQNAHVHSVKPALNNKAPGDLTLEKIFGALLKMSTGKYNITHQIHEYVTIIGLAKDCDFEIPDDFDNVERYHATISYRDGIFVITDGHKNRPTKFGTYVNGVKVEFETEVPLRSGDRIVLGGFRRKEAHELSRGACEVVFQVGVTQRG
jgi:nucleoside phosphorylase